MIGPGTEPPAAPRATGDAWRVAVAAVVCAALLATTAEAKQPVTAKATQEACDVAADLVWVGLLDDGRAAYRRLSDAGVKSCPRSPGPSSKPGRSIAAAEAEIARRERHRARALERARTYRRVAAIRRSKGLVAGRSTALRRAQAAYVEALGIDPFSAGARRGLMSVLAQRGGPTHQASANARCAQAAQIAGDGLLPEARLFYAKALRTGRTNACLAGMKALRDRRAHAIDALTAARAAEHDSRPDDARKQYVMALSSDSSLRGAVASLRALPPPALTRKVGAPKHFRNGVNATMDWLNDRLKWLADNWKAILLIALGLTLLWIALSLWLSRRWFAAGSERSDWCEGRRWLRRFGKPRVGVVAATGGDDDTNRQVTGMIRTGLTTEPVPEEVPYGAPAVLQGGPSIDSVISLDSLGPSPELLDLVKEVPQGSAITAFIRWTTSKTGRHLSRITPELLEGGPRGTGLAVTVKDWKGRSTRKEFWPLAAALLPGDAEKADAQGASLFDVVTQAIEWLRAHAFQLQPS